MKIACVNYEPVTLYRNQGWSSERLGRYYNPNDVAEEVSVFAYRDQDWKVSPSVKVSGWRSFKELERKCKAFNPDIVRCYEAFRPYSDCALLLAMSLRVPSYLSLHDNRLHYYSSLSEFSAITAYTETLAKKATKELRRTVETQLNGIYSKVFSPKVPLSIDPRVASKKYRLFTISRKDPVKNVETSIKATEILSKEVDSVAHVIAGPGTEDIAYDGVHLGLGPLTEQMIAEYLNWCSCFLQVQLISEIGMAAAEALMVGRPIITTGDSHGIAQYVIDARKGVIIPIEKVKDAEFIAHAISECLNSKYDYENIRKWAIERYDAEGLKQKEAERYTRLYSTKSRVSYSKLTRLKLLPAVWKMGFS
jgi:glycosyltransferase involved in cell wall biosynthesis